MLSGSKKLEDVTFKFFQYLPVRFREDSYSAVTAEEKRKELTIMSVPNEDALLWSSGPTLQGTKLALASLCPFIICPISKCQHS